MSASENYSIDWQQESENFNFDSFDDPSREPPQVIDPQLEQGSETSKTTWSESILPNYGNTDDLAASGQMDAASTGVHATVVTEQDPIVQSLSLQAQNQARALSFGQIPSYIDASYQAFPSTNIGRQTAGYASFGMEDDQSNIKYDAHNQAGYLAYPAQAQNLADNRPSQSPYHITANTPYATAHGGQFPPAGGYALPMAPLMVQHQPTFVPQPAPQHQPFVPIVSTQEEDDEDFEERKPKISAGSDDKICAAVDCTRTVPKRGTRTLCNRCTKKQEKQNATYQPIRHVDMSMEEACNQVHAPIPPLMPDEMTDEERAAWDADVALHIDDSRAPGHWINKMIDAVNTPYDLDGESAKKLKRSDDQHMALLTTQTAFEQKFHDQKAQYNELMINARLRILWETVVTLYKGGVLHYDEGGDNSGYRITKNLLPSVRLRMICDVLTLDKRVVMDVIEGRGVNAFARDPEAYERRKQDNVTSNAKKAKTRRAAKARDVLEAQQQVRPRAVPRRAVRSSQQMDAGLPPSATSQTGMLPQPPASASTVHTRLQTIAAAAGVANLSTTPAPATTTRAPQPRAPLILDPPRSERTMKRKREMEEEEQIKAETAIDFANLQQGLAGYQHNSNLYGLPQPALHVQQQTGMTPQSTLSNGGQMYFHDGSVSRQYTPVMPGAYGAAGQSQQTMSAAYYGQQGMSVNNTLSTNPDGERSNKRVCLDPPGGGSEPHGLTPPAAAYTGYNNPVQCQDDAQHLLHQIQDPGSMLAPSASPVFTRSSQAQRLNASAPYSGATNFSNPNAKRPEGYDENGLLTQEELEALKSFQ